MLDRSKKRPRDPNQLAYQIMLESTGQAEPLTAAVMDSVDIPIDPNKNPHAVALGRLGGIKGGAARAAALTPRKRSQIAAKAAKARWGNSENKTLVPSQPTPLGPERVKTQYPLQTPAKLPPPPPPSKKTP
jgi:hypothetical protein